MLDALVERWGENGTLLAGGLLIGLVFGFFAQRSRFCLRSAVIEFGRNLTGGKLTVWLFAFASAWLTVWLIIRFEHLHAHLSHDHVASGPQKYHAHPTPRIGGLAVMVGLLTGGAVLLFATTSITLLILG
jgi:UDP-N-acetylmuramyl pentapeptide phosphotransferase/UDP-N-acetylglucosamine-1-phosphate transferase